MRKVYFILAFVLLSAAPFAQTDSAVIANANWNQEQIYGGVVYGFNHFNNLFASNQSISVIDVDLNTAHVKIIFPYTTGRQLTSSLASNAGAIAAVNGTFFNTTTGGAIEYFKVNGTVVNTTSASAPNDTMDYLDEAALSMLTTGIPEITRIPQSNVWTSFTSNTQYPSMMAAGPLLLYSGSNVPYVSKAFNTGRNPRTAVCLTASNHLKLMTVDGRTTMAAGATAGEMQTLSKGLGCRDALNYDGGGSTTMWISGKPNNGVVNYPSDNGVYDHLGERTVANAIAIIPDGSTGIQMKNRRRTEGFTIPNGTEILNFYDPTGRLLETPPHHVPRSFFRKPLLTKLKP